MSDYDPMAHGARCDECPLRGRPVVPPEGPDDATFAVVGEAPIREDEIRQRPFISPGGRLLEEMLEQANLARSEVWLTNVLLCRPRVPGMTGARQYDLNGYFAWLRLKNREEQKNHQPLTPSPLDCCRPRLMAELRAVDYAAREQPNGAVVLALGNLATKTLTNKLGVSKLRGSPVPVTINGDTIQARWDPRPTGAGA